MSQAKVDNKKVEKQNRKATVKKRKVGNVVRVILTTIVCIAIVGWVGYSLYGKIDAALEARQNAVPTEYEEIDLSGITDYLYSMD